jgi:hypothetical protein
LKSFRPPALPLPGSPSSAAKWALVLPVRSARASSGSRNSA